VFLIVRGYFISTGMNIVMRKIASKVKPVHTIEQDGNKFTLVITGTPKRETVTFTVGEEFKHTVPVFKGELTVSTGNHLYH
jgi:hypothetical protein